MRESLSPTNSWDEHALRQHLRGPLNFMGFGSSMLRPFIYAA